MGLGRVFLAVLRLENLQEKSECMEEKFQGFPRVFHFEGFKTVLISAIKLCQRGRHRRIRSIVKKNWNDATGKIQSN